MRPQRPHSGVLYEMMRAKTALASLSLLLTLSLSGCGSDSTLTDYTSQMNTFYDAFSSGTLALEQIDPSSETAQEELLSGLDELTALTDSLADISVPEALCRRRNRRAGCPGGGTHAGSGQPVPRSLQRRDFRPGTCQRRTGTLSTRNETNPLHRHHAAGQDAGR